VPFLTLSLAARLGGGHACQALIFASSASFEHTEVTVPNISFKPLQQQISGSVSHVFSVSHAAPIE
jgi:hypothetical protein